MAKSVMEMTIEEFEDAAEDWVNRGEGYDWKSQSTEPDILKELDEAFERFYRAQARRLHKVS